MYESVKPTDNRGALVWAALGAKTMELVHANIEVGEVHEDLDILTLDANLIDEFIRNQKDINKTTRKIEIDLVDRSSISFTFSPLSYTMDAYLIGGCIHEKKRNCRPVGRGKVRLAEDSKHQDRRGQTRSACKDPTIGC